MSLQGVLFDLDGIITQTATLHAQAWADLAQAHFGMSLPPTVAEATKGVDRETSLKIVLSSLDQQVTPAVFKRLAAEKNARYQVSLADLTPASILPGIPDLLATLRKAGIKLALASASQNGPRILQQLGLSESFDAIADPTQVAHGKPAPDIFIAAAHAVALAPEVCVGVEDAQAGVLAINASGAVAVAVGDAKLLQAAQVVVPSTAELSLPLLQKAWLTAQDRQ